MATRVLERTSPKLTATIVDEAGVAIAAAQLSTLTLTLFDRATGTIINTRNDQDVLNDNDVTVSALGALVWAMQPDDNIIVRPGKRLEVHRALFQFTWASGAKSGAHYEDLEVENLDTVT